MKVIDLLNKIANGELEENTKFYDKYEHKEYIYKPKSYNGIYHEGIAYANENWYLTLKGSSRLLDEVEIIEDTPKEYVNVSEEQVLFNNLIYEEQQFILKQMRILNKINGDSNERNK